MSTRYVITAKTHMELLPMTPSAAPVTGEAPKYLLGKMTRQSNKRKLTIHDVREIRYWARSDGFGLPATTQSRIMAKQFGVQPATVLDVIQNKSWHDLQYVPGEPLPGKVPVLLTCSFLPAVFLQFLLWWSLLCSDGSGGSGTEQPSLSL